MAEGIGFEPVAMHIRGGASGTNLPELTRKAYCEKLCYTLAISEDFFLVLRLRLSQQEKNRAAKITVYTVSPIHGYVDFWCLFI